MLTPDLKERVHRRIGEGVALQRLHHGLGACVVDLEAHLGGMRGGRGDRLGRTEVRAPRETPGGGEHDQQGCCERTGFLSEASHRPVLFG